MNRRKKKRTLLGRIWRLVFIKLPLAFLTVTLLWVTVLKWCPVVVTPLMISRSIEFRNDESFRTHKHWRGYDRISPEMARAVIASEDDLFATHNGFNWKAIEKAWHNNKAGKKLRGGSTISQQTAKNVFCGSRRSWVRKGFESYFTVLIEFIWGKRRIMEVYLNVAEMGRGIYGAEAAARELFGTTADKLSRQQSCLIAACLPRPLKRNAAAPSDYVIVRANKIKAMEAHIAYPEWVYHKKTEEFSAKDRRK